MNPTVNTSTPMSTLLYIFHPNIDTSERNKALLALIDPGEQLIVRNFVALYKDVKLSE